MTTRPKTFFAYTASHSDRHCRNSKKKSTFIIFLGEKFFIFSASIRMSTLYLCCNLADLPHPFINIFCLLLSILYSRYYFFPGQNLLWESFVPGGKPCLSLSLSLSHSLSPFLFLTLSLSLSKGKDLSMCLADMIESIETDNPGESEKECKRGSERQR